MSRDVVFNIGPIVKRWKFFLNANFKTHHSEPFIPNRKYKYNIIKRKKSVQKKEVNIIQTYIMNEPWSDPKT